MQEIGSSKKLLVQFESSLAIEENAKIVAKWPGKTLTSWRDVGDFSREGFCPSWKIHRRDFVHLVKKSWGYYIHVAKNTEGIMSTYTKMSRRDFVREGYCPYTF